MDDKKTANATAEKVGESSMVVPSAEVDLISFPDKEVDIGKVVEKVEKAIAQFKAVKIISLKLTNPEDWVIQKRGESDRGTPFPMDRGLENIRLAFGIDVSGLNLRLENSTDEKGDYYTWVATGKAFSRKLGTYIEDIGVCSQRDKFFGMIGGKLKEVEDVDAANIRKKAVTNLYSRLIRRTVGLLNVTFDDLQTAGFDISRMQSVTYREGAKGGRVPLSEEAQKIAKAIDEIALLLAHGDPEGAKAQVKEASQFTASSGALKFGESSADITTEGWIRSTYGRIKQIMAQKDPETFKERYPGEPLPKTKNGK
jgi:hypothetical protein